MTLHGKLAGRLALPKLADKAQAVEALAALELSGIKHVYIGSSPGADLPPYELRVPHDTVQRASPGDRKQKSWRLLAQVSG
jgi:hypothetical protein